YVGTAEAAIAAAGADHVAIFKAADHAWRGMFLAVVYPGLLFLAGTVCLPESPRWLVRKQRLPEARAVLLRIRAPAACSAELASIEQALAREARQEHLSWLAGVREILTQRRYVWPFILACLILACTQATGINSILQFMSTILLSAGLGAVATAESAVAIKIVNVVFTVLAILLVERKGRVFLLKLGTGGIALALLLLALIFHRIEAGQSAVQDQLTGLIRHDTLELTLAAPPGQDQQLSVLYAYGEREGHAAVRAPAGGKAVLRIVPRSGADARQPLRIVRALAGPAPPRLTGLMAALCIALFVASFAIGPGICVWLALSELMPNRIRSVGMGIALLINQSVGTAVAFLFLPVVGSHGYAAMFLFWATCSLLYFITVAAFLPETKGKSLEEIERHFERRKSGAPVRAGGGK
ncbi:MAG TPA: MFS transporter, partial [Telluria sp.]|nr:MFS transporter [Telluria sp.]